jgi:small multidrug resistance family-3 protein
MNKATVLVILFAAALLEAGGDALIRCGLHAGTAMQRGLLFTLGALVLFAYGYTVNAPNWEFGKLLGIYVVFFFFVAQAVSWLVFHQRPGNPVLIGGAFIAAGGLIISFA